MGREILFRGKRKIDGKWIYGNLLRTDEGIFIIQNHVPYHLLEKYEVLEETVCQYAGFSDCNKAKVFEKDILKGKGKLYIVEFNSSCGAFTTRSNAKGSLRCFFGKTESQYMEVVGNVFDNPELLNQ